MIALNQTRLEFNEGNESLNTRQLRLMNSNFLILEIIDLEGKGQETFFGEVYKWDRNKFSSEVVKEVKCIIFRKFVFPQIRIIRDEIAIDVAITNFERSALIFFLEISTIFCLLAWIVHINRSHPNRCPMKKFFLSKSGIVI